MPSAPPDATPICLAADVFHNEAGTLHGPVACHGEGQSHALFSDGSLRIVRDASGALNGYGHHQVEAGLNAITGMCR